MKFSAIRVLSAFCFLLFLFRVSAQDCNPDITPPTVVCNETVFISLDATGSATIDASVFDAGTYDACCLSTLLVQRLSLDGPCDGDGDPDGFTGTITFCCAEIGQSLFVTLRAVDCAGNTNDCITEVTLEDKLKPVCTAPADVTVGCENFDPSLLAYGLAQVADNCCIDTVTTTTNYGQFNSSCNNGSITRTFRVFDCSGNSSQCSQKISVTLGQYYFVHFPNDVLTTGQYAAQSPYGEPVFFGEDCEALASSYSDLVFIGDTVKVERTWSIINWCTYNPNLGQTTIPNPQPHANIFHATNLPGPVVSAAGTAAPWNPTVVKITPTDPAPTNYSSFFNPDVNAYEYTQHLYFVTDPPAVITGKVFIDSTSNCSYDSGEMPLVNWTVRATGQPSGHVYQAQTNASGDYSLAVSALDTLVELALDVAFNYGQNCPSVFTFNVMGNQNYTQDISAHLQADCPLMSVDLATPIMRRCFPNTYTVQACNLGTETVEDVHVEVRLDDYLDYNYSSIPAADLGNNLYSFELGNLAAGACQTFFINFNVSCTAPIGYTHCSTAHIYPDTICDTQADWNGAEIQVSGHCDGDTVRMHILNEGIAPMSGSADFVVVEDVVMLYTGSFQLNAGASQDFAFPANGSTWRLEAEQEPTYPWNGVEAVAVEGCGGLNIPGLVTLFPMNPPNPFEATDCMENVGSYDPNDKQAFPRGYGAEHQIEANTDIEYLIRFQNTGTDTAFTVVVLDTLSAYLDAQAVRPGASSHPYDFAVLDGQILRFTFDHILLPDSNVNEPGSHGFIKFRVPQTPDNPDGTRIENRAAIYFDFNDPVLTNTTFHTVGDHFILVKTGEAPEGLRLNVYPNPAVGSAVFELPGEVSDAVFTLTDQLGRSVRREQFSGKQYRLERQDLPAGVYFYTIRLSSQAAFTGKVSVR